MIGTSQTMTHSIRVASLLAFIVACILLASSTANHLRVKDKTTSNNQLVTSESEETQIVVCAAVGIATWLWKIGKYVGEIISTIIYLFYLI